MDQGEIDTFTELVRAFLLVKPSKPVNVLVGWCLNDYQIDVATAEGRAEYKRIFDQAAAVGADYVLYAPSNSDVSRRELSVDDWSWEHVLWLSLGQKIRANEWNPKTGAVPPSIQEMLDAARAKNLKLLAYVYPVLPFAQDPAWLVADKNNPSRKHANLGFRALQDFLIENLVAFHDRLGLGGYAFDHTFLNYEGTSRYAQWAGWRRVMEELRRRIPDIVIDGRQAYHLYGPWSWLAGSYPHPTFSDEQPESFVPFPDLHFDRVSADRERYTAYRYRNYEFAPSEIVPGFMTHQTSRSDDTGEMPERKTDKGVMLLPFRARDWDSLGFRYSVLSSIAVGGLNNVIDMIPARDLEENQAFECSADRAWFRKWIDWTAANRESLRHTRTILGQPQLGKIDGVSAMIADSGYIFLFNPNGRQLTTEVALDETSGVPPDRRFQLRELEPLEGRIIGKPGSGVWSSGDRVPITLDGGSALVIQVQPMRGPASVPLLLHVPGKVGVDNGVVNIVGARGEMGTEQEIQVLLPPGQAATGMSVNGQKVDFTAAGQLVSAKVRFDGAPFRHYQQLGEYDPAFAGGRFATRFTVPQRVFDQLVLRQKTWPIAWTSADYQATWLAPDRLLLFVQIAEPDPKWEARLWIDGRQVELRKAYSAIRTTAPRTFVGFYADITLIEPDKPHALELDLPPLRAGCFQGVFFENVETVYTDRLVPAGAPRIP
jgi:hypothetical protein